ncbi:MAG: transglutaminase family protein, partial [Clostridia bacterium]
QCVLRSWRDSFGNRVEMGYMPDLHSVFAYRVSGTAYIDSEGSEGGGYRPFYKYPSRYTEAGTDIKKLNSGLVLPKENPLKAADMIMRAVNGAVCYQKGVTSTSTTAEEALTGGRGVCQDYAHIMLALLRLNGIPCRYAAGMMEGEGESHAWTEVFCDGAWHGFDPTNNRLIDDGYIKITHGRDFGDCSLDRGVFYGKAEQTQIVEVVVK